MSVKLPLNCTISQNVAISMANWVYGSFQLGVSQLKTMHPSTTHECLAGLGSQPFLAVLC